MFNLLDKNVSYILISPEKRENTLQENAITCSKSCNILYAKGYTVIPITGFHKGEYDKSFIGISSSNNDDLRTDSIFLMDEFQQESIIVKYFGDDTPTKIKSDGSEKSLSLLVYEDTNSKSYIYNGYSFSFRENKRYFIPKRKEDLRNGMVIEYFNNNKWNTKQISNIELEFDKLYKLLIKYEKLRVECV